IVLRNADVPSQLTLEGSKVSGLLDMYGIQIGTNLLMDNSEFAEVDLENAQIGGQLDFSGSTFHENVTLNGAHIGGTVQFVSAQWSDHAILYLRNARADVIPSLSDPW